MRVVQVARRYTPTKWGGTETVIRETARRMQPLLHEVEIWSSDALSQPGITTVDGVTVQRFPYIYPYLGLSESGRQQLDLKGGNLVSFELYRALQRVPELDLLHLHTGKRLGGICRRVAQKRSIPYVVSLHGGVFDVPPAEAATWTEPTQGTIEWGKLLGWWFGSRRVLQDADAVICVGKQESELAASRLPNTRVEYLPNGVDSRHFQSGNGAAFRHRWGISQDSRVVLLVGRIDRQKNQKLAIELIDQLRRDDPSWHLVLAGPVTDEPYSDLLGQEIAQRSLSRHVTRTGPLDPGGDDLRDAYHAADILVLPSRHEPFGIVALEAWAAGLPVIASRVGGLKGLIHDSVNGLLIDPDDRLGWLRALETVAASPEKGERLADEGHRLCRDLYDWDAITRRLLSLYEDVVKTRDLAGSQQLEGIS